MTYMSRIQASPAENARQEAQAALQPQRLFEMTPIIHPNNGVADPASRTFWSAVANAHYIVREDGEDVYGATPGFAAKLRDCPDLVDHGRRGPIGCDADAISGMSLWRGGAKGAPQDMDRASWRDLVLEFLDEQVVRSGMIADWAIHALSDGDGGWIKRPHFHAVITSRFWRRDRRHGEPQGAWFPTVKRRVAAGDAWEEIVRCAIIRETA
jgi:hypothetical protein